MEPHWRAICQFECRRTTYHTSVTKINSGSSVTKIATRRIISINQWGENTLTFVSQQGGSQGHEFGIQNAFSLACVNVKSSSQNVPSL